MHPKLLREIERKAGGGLATEGRGATPGMVVPEEELHRGGPRQGRSRREGAPGEGPRSGGPRRGGAAPEEGHAGRGGMPGQRWRRREGRRSGGVPGRRMEKEGVAVRQGRPEEKKRRKEKGQWGDVACSIPSKIRGGGERAVHEERRSRVREREIPTLQLLAASWAKGLCLYSKEDFPPAHELATGPTS